MSFCSRRKAWSSLKSASRLRVLGDSMIKTPCVDCSPGDGLPTTSPHPRGSQLAAQAAPKLHRKRAAHLARMAEARGGLRGWRGLRGIGFGLKVGQIQGGLFVNCSRFSLSDKSGTPCYMSNAHAMSIFELGGIVGPSLGRHIYLMKQAGTGRKHTF